MMMPAIPLGWWWLRAAALALLILWPAGQATAQIPAGPPTVSLSPTPTETQSDLLPLSGTIGDRVGVRGYRIYHNHELKGTRELPPQTEVKVSGLLRLRQEGPNVIEIIPINSAGNLSPKRHSLTVMYRRPPFRLWAVVVGVGKYKSSQIAPCAFCAQDATQYATALQVRAAQNLPPDAIRITALVGSLATRRNIDIALREASRQAGPDDVLVFYFAGNSATTVEGPGVAGVVHQILPYDADIDSLALSAMSLPSLGTLLSRGQGRVYALLDTSFASPEKGAAGRAVAGARPLTDAERDAMQRKLASNRWLEELAAGGRIHVLASGRGLDGAAESVQRQHGLFTLYLLEVLDGKGDVNGDGRIDLEEAFAYIHKRVREDTSALQLPVRMSRTATNPILVGPLASRPGPTVRITELSEREGRVLVSARLEAPAGIAEYAVQVNGVTVTSAKVVPARGSYEFSYQALLAPYGNRVVVVARDAQGLEGRESQTVLNDPKLPFTPVALDVLMKASADDGTTGAWVRRARYDIQKILGDFERLLDKQVMSQERYDFASAFWRRVLQDLDEALKDNDRDQRKAHLGAMWAKVEGNRVVVNLDRSILDPSKRRLDLWTDEQQFTVAARPEVTSDAGGGSTGTSALLRVKVNDLPVVSQGFKGKYTFIRQIPLMDGQNRIEVRVESELGMSDTATFNVARFPVQDMVAIVLGVNSYRGRAALQYAEKDAKDVATYILMRTTTSRERIKLLLGRDVTRDKIMATMEDAIRRWPAVRRSRVLTYYSGLGATGDHGERQLVLSDDVDAQRTILVRDLIELIDDALRPSEALLILDAGFVTGRTPPTGLRSKATTRAPKILSVAPGSGALEGLDDRADGALVPPGNWAVLAASNGDAYEPAGIGSGRVANGLLTYHLLHRLQDLNSDEIVDPSDLEQPVALDLFNVFEGIEDLVGKDTEGGQVPQLVSSLPQPFIFEYLPPSQIYRKAKAIIRDYSQGRGDIELDAEGAAKVRRLLEKARDMDEKDSVTLLWLGYLDSIEGRYVTSEENFQRAVATAPQDDKADYYAIWAEAKFRMVDYLGAERIYRERATLQPADPNHRIDHAYSVVRSGRVDEGVALLEALRSDPEVEKNSTARAAVLLRLGDAQRVKGAYVEAYPLYEEARRKGYDETILNDRFAWSTFAMGEYDKVAGYADQSYHREIYLHLLKYFAALLSGKKQEAQALLADAPVSGRNVLSDRLVGYLRGESDLATVLGSAAEDPVSEAKANFFAGLAALASGAHAEARERLQRTIDTNARHRPEWLTARVMLTRLPPP